MKLHVHEWGEPAAPALVCLHGVTAVGARFRRLAEERLAQRFHVLAPDLRGHGDSAREPPWDLDTHVADVLETAAVDRAVWLGHSFGGRIVLELAAREPERVERAVLLDPALRILPHVAEAMADEELKDVSFASLDEAIDARLESGRLFHTPRELLVDELPHFYRQTADGRWRPRYFRAAVVTAWSEMATAPPAYERARVPTLLVLGAESWIMLDEDVEAYRAALGDLLEVVVVPGGHVVFWDAFTETADAVERFLAA